MNRREFIAPQYDTERVMPQELLFELDDVRITPYIAQFGGTSYQIGSISGVRVGQAKRLNRGAVIVFLLGVGLFVAAILRSGSEELAEANFPLAASAAGIMFSAFLFQLVLPKRVFKLILRAHGSDVEVLTSTRRKFIVDVKQAVEGAFIAHAHRSSPQASE
jgi:ABC-type amino acid transport system permease subunit